MLLSFQFTFAKIWLLYAQFEIRQKNLQGSRRVMVSLQNIYITLYQYLAYIYLFVVFVR